MEKVTSILSLSLFVRIFIPGAIAVVVLFPILKPITTVVALWGKYPPYSDAILVTVILLGTGFLAVLLDHFIYRTYEGYLFPRRLRERLTQRLNEAIEKKIAEADDFKRQGKIVDYDLVWEWLGRFVIDEESAGPVKPKAVLPTHFGNILYQYENYPSSRYGMEAIFYWPRLWLTVDDQIRKECEVTWAWGDSLLYVSAVSCIGALLNALAFFVHFFNLPTKVSELLGINFRNSVLFDLPSPYFFLLLAVLSASISCAAYQISLPVHYRIGEQFKAMYDLHRERLEPLTEVYRRAEMLTTERSLWEKTRKFLEYLKREP